MECKITESKNEREIKKKSTKFKTVDELKRKALVNMVCCARSDVQETFNYFLLEWHECLCIFVSNKADDILFFSFR